MEWWQDASGAIDASDASGASGASDASGASGASDASGASGATLVRKRTFTEDEGGNPLPEGWRMAVSRKTRKPYYWHVDDKADPLKRYYTLEKGIQAKADEEHGTTHASSMGAEGGDRRAGGDGEAGGDASDKKYHKRVARARADYKYRLDEKAADKLLEMQVMIKDGLADQAEWTLPPGWTIGYDELGVQKYFGPPTASVLARAGTTDPFDDMITGLPKPPEMFKRPIHVVESPPVTTDVPSGGAGVNPLGQLLTAAGKETGSLNTDENIDDLLGVGGGKRRKKKHKSKKKKKSKRKKYTKRKKSKSRKRRYK